MKPTRRNPKAGWALLVALLLVARPAAADPTDLLGFGARSLGLANAGAAVARGGAAAMWNPAGVAAIDSAELTLSYATGSLGLEINHQNAHVVSPSGLQLGLALPFKLSSDVTAAIGLGLFMPDRWIVRIQLVPSTEPRFLLYDNDKNRIVANPILGVRIGRELAIGAGASVLADVGGSGVRFDVGVEGGEKVGRSAIDLEIPTRAAPLVGVLWSPTDKLQVGLGWRGEIDLKLRLDIVANVNVVGVVQGDAIIALRAVNFYTPHRLTLGAAWEVADGVLVTGDVAYAKWSGYHGGVAELQILVDLGVTPSLASAAFPQDKLSDTLAVRGGSELRFPILGITGLARFGLGYEPSPVPDQVLATNFADNDRVILSSGVGVELPGTKGGLLERPLSFDLGAQWQQLLERTTRKLAATLPALQSGGSIVIAALTATARF